MSNEDYASVLSMPNGQEELQWSSLEASDELSGIGQGLS